MDDKPRGLGPEYAAQFQDPSVVAVYHLRPAYPAELFDRLVALMPVAPASARVLDLGCGTGDIARPLAPRVARVDAIDLSAPMVARGRALPGGDDPRLRWIVAPAESAPLTSPYALAIAGESLHWMDWPVVLPRVAAVLAPGALLAIVQRREEQPWWPALQPLIDRYSTNREFEPYDLVAELEQRGLFRPLGEECAGMRPIRATPEQVIEAFHSRNGFSRDRMSRDDALAFDGAFRALLVPHLSDGRLTWQAGATLTWGLPAPTR